MTTPTYVEEIDAIRAVVQHYIDGAHTGRGDTMKPAFHDDATIFGYVGPDLVAGPIQALFDWTDANEAATDVEVRFTSFDIVGTVASVRLDIDNWGGHRFTDVFNMLKIDGAWTIVSKAFHLHG